VSGALLVCALAFLFAFTIAAHRLTARWLTAPILFVAFGALLGDNGLGWVALGPLQPYLDPLAELTLIIILFGDASRIDLRQLREEAGLPVRLLLVGLPLTILLGAAAATTLFPSLSLWEAAALGAVLAPTDAALGQAVVSSPEVPMRVRQALNVESGLNDGIALPVVLVFVALAVASAEGMGGTDAAQWLGFWALQVTGGPLFGAAIGLGGGWLLERALVAGWTDDVYARIGGLALALLAAFGAEELGGNGFMAAFVAGLALGHTSPRVCESTHAFLETEGQLLMLLVFVALGALLVPPALSALSVPVVVYVLLSLTLIRMVPTALALWGSGAQRQSVAFIGWFGPRGLATILFGMILVEEQALPDRVFLFDVAVLTVFASVFAHGLTAGWGARRYGRWMREQDEAMEHDEVHAHPLRVRR
jgi:NhaP-type Na+/H+ or K+/H+ antiporter